MDDWEKKEEHRIRVKLWAKKRRKAVSMARKAFPYLASVMSRGGLPIYAVRNCGVASLATMVYRIALDKKGA